MGKGVGKDVMKDVMNEVVKDVLKGVFKGVLMGLLQIAATNVCFFQRAASATAYEKYNVNNSIAIYMYNTKYSGIKECGSTNPDGISTSVPLLVILSKL